MSLKEKQACIARLYVDDSFRTLFFQNSIDTSKDYSLTQKELSALVSLDKGMIDYFASTLKTKRIKQFIRAYPLLFQLENKEVLRFAHRYCCLYVRHPTTLLHDDILEFGLFMEGSIDGFDGLPSYTSELIKFEKLVYNLAFQERTWQKPELRFNTPIKSIDVLDKPMVSDKVERFKFTFDILKVIDSLSANTSTNEDSFERGSFYILAGINQITGSIILMQINESVYNLLSFCDGNKTIESIIKTYTNGEGSFNVEKSIMDSLQRLATASVLTTSTKK